MDSCEDDTDDVDGYSCYNSFGMAAVAWFASFLLISEAVTLAALISWKEDIFFVDGGWVWCFFMSRPRTETLCPAAFQAEADTITRVRVGW